MRLVLALAIWIPSGLLSQTLVPEFLTDLATSANETSGLVVIDGVVWTILDSGNPAAVYAVDPTDGSIVRTVDLIGADNLDFEEITADDQWVYIGDFGNNLGSRANLRIFRIPRSALEDEGTTEVAVDTIRFSFSDQTDFTPAFDNTNFDCEAFVAIDDSLFLFTKHWIDGETSLYALPAEPGDHVAQWRDNFDPSGLITAATWDGNDRLVLLGHEGDPGQPFIVLFNHVEGHDLFGPVGIRRDLDMLFHQTEGIAWYTPDEWIISNELNGNAPAQLWSVEAGWTAIAEEGQSIAPRLFPQPAGNEVWLKGFHSHAEATIMDDAGRTVRQEQIGPERAMDTSGLRSGSYVLIVVAAESSWRLPLVVIH